MTRVGRGAPSLDDEGSIIPLVLGYALLIGAVLFAGVGITDAYAAQRRIDALADAAAVAAADGFVLEPGPVARLDIDAARSNVDAVLAASDEQARVMTITADGVATVHVTVAGVWHPPLAAALFPDGVTMQAIGTARTAIG